MVLGAPLQPKQPQNGLGKGNRCVFAHYNPVQYRFFERAIGIAPNGTTFEQLSPNAKPVRIGRVALWNPVGYGMT